MFTADDAGLLQLAADRAALAVQSLRSRQDRAAAAALQRSRAPSALPAVRGVEVAARYVPGSGRVGGDWYDVFVLPCGELGLMVGDVAGFRARRCGHHGPVRGHRRSSDCASLKHLIGTLPASRDGRLPSGLTRGPPRRA